MSWVIKEVFLQEFPYFQTYVTFFPGTEHMLHVQDIFHEQDITGSILVLKKPVSLSCENCKKEIEVLKEDDFGEPVDWNTPWEQYLCDVCHGKIWDELLKSACSVCETEPCKRGRDCWVNTWPRIMYLCYVALRVKEVE
jgi:hypothetical protein